MKYRLLSITLMGGAMLAAQSPAPTAESRLLGWMDRIAQEQLDRRAAEIAKVRTPEQADARKQYVRAKILELIGGLPDYSGPLNANVTGRIDKGKYVIENVVFESLPKVWVTANLYRPAEPGRYPAVLLPLGHWDQGKPAVQLIAANLALKGFVTLAYDPIGQGERLQAYDQRTGKSLAGGSTDQHFLPGAQSILAGESFARYRIWDAKRALDYLVSRPEVDSERIGCTGCSGGGTLTTYISALDPRIKVAAPACYMNSFRILFPGPVGDSEQSLPSFLSSGLDQTDYVELFAPKPWLIANTVDDFFPLEGARQVYQEAKRWYSVYGAEEKIAWVIGPGGHGTPLPVREAIYGWMIRWLKDGRGDAREEEVEILPDHELLATKTGQVSTGLGSRDIYEAIRDGAKSRMQSGTSGELLNALRNWMRPVAETPLTVKVVAETSTADITTQTVTFETERGLEIGGALLIPRGAVRRPGVVVVETGPPSPLALQLARKGAVVLALSPRGLPWSVSIRQLPGDWLAATRAWLIGKNMPGLRAYDIKRGVDLLAARPDVDPVSIRAVARDAAGVWLLMAAATDARIGGVWLDRTPHSLRAVMDRPLHFNLHAALMPGFCLKWDLADLVKAIAPRKVLWTDPTDWMGNVIHVDGDYRYRPFETPDTPYIDMLLR